MHSFTRTVLTSIAALTLLISGCTSVTDAVRPEQQSASENLNDSACTPDSLINPSGTQRFLVDWNDGDRSSLEDEMHEGVALIKYTCEGMEVLRSCAQPGDYGYRASNSQKSQTLQIADAVSAAANFSSPTAGVGFQALFDQDRALNLAYVMVGSQTSQIKDINRSAIDRAACQGATHFVYQTQLGAFKMAAGEKGEAATAAEVFGFGDAGASASSSRDVLSADGDAQACENASPDDASAPHGCGALMRVSILPITN